MNAPASPASRQPAGTPPPTRNQQHPRRRPAPLTEDQYVASSLALIADLSRRVRGGTTRHG